MIVSVPSEYQSAPSVNHSVPVKHESSKMNGVLYGKYVYIICVLCLDLGFVNISCFLPSEYHSVVVAI